MFGAVIILYFTITDRFIFVVDLNVYKQKNHT